MKNYVKSTESLSELTISSRKDLSIKDTELELMYEKMNANVLLKEDLKAVRFWDLASYVGVKYTDVVYYCELGHLLFITICEKGYIVLDYYAIDFIEKWRSFVDSQKQLQKKPKKFRYKNVSLQQ